jgi:hypothetical protein
MPLRSCNPFAMATKHMIQIPSIPARSRCRALRSAARVFAERSSVDATREESRTDRTRTRAGVVVKGIRHHLEYAQRFLSRVRDRESFPIDDADAMIRSPTARRLRCWERDANLRQISAYVLVEILDRSQSVLSVVAGPTKTFDATRGQNGYLA